ncbi:hypothetical protein [Nocardia aurea]|uniref:hypothetical protein n=1 Tax=Nocardia aurea TaxID=2144174 RepID=UPI0033B2F4C8
MSVNPRVQDVVRQSWPKRQPRVSKRSKGDFSQAVKHLVDTRAKDMCELDGCGPIEVYHHRRPRGSGGSGLPWVGQAANCLGLTNRCHDWVEGKITGSSRTVSTENGWLVSMNGSVRADAVKVLYRGKDVYLTDDGRVVPASKEGKA